MRTRPQLDGNILLVPVPDEHRAGVAVTLEKARGGWLDVLVELPRKPRSTGKGSQSAHFHGHCAQLAMLLETSPAMAKRYVKVRACENGYPFEVLKHGGKTIVEPRSEALATTAEESILIETCHIIASEHGWTLFEGEND